MNATNTTTSPSNNVRKQRPKRARMLAVAAALSVLTPVLSSAYTRPVSAQVKTDLKPRGQGDAVIVNAKPGQLDAVVTSLTSAGASIERTLPMINSVAARIAQGKRSAVSAMPGVELVTDDAVMAQPKADKDADKAADKTAEKAADKSAKDAAKEAERAAKEAERAAKEADRANKDAERAAKEAEREAKDAEKNDQETDRDDDPAVAAGSRDAGSIDSIARMTGARKLWRRGLTGKGVDVALIDTGVAPVAGAPTTVNGADLSFDAPQANLRFLDAYGHGTHLAGIIAGRDASVTNPAKAGGAFVGIAPGARVVNVKVGAVDGSVHVSQVVAALDWAVQNKAENGMNIRVVNLAFGAPATDWRTDPLAWASEVAWRKGVVVVAAAGNEGTGHELASPAYSPAVLAVGATEVEMQRGGRADYAIAPYTSTGTRRRPDLYVPGGHVISLRVKGSYIDTFLAKSNINDQLTRGTGTSQATAVTSGLVALLLQAYPSATPDQIKAMLVSATASSHRRDVTGIEANVDVYEAFKAAKKKLPVVQPTDPFEGCGDTWCRGIADGSQAYVDWAKASWAGSGWLGSGWLGSGWLGSGWLGSGWAGSSWNGSGWLGSGWLGSGWENWGWNGSGWSGSGWSGSGWSGSGWSGSGWSGSGWSGSGWSGSGWSGSGWSGSGWSGSAWSSAWSAS